ncbi:MAG TPA: glutamyl-tRNA reductase [Candidatus Kapabacteria bacterium]|nr:glutamyl-tRNA reductase [Candidatus Kapabacteria bacterium]
MPQKLVAIALTHKTAPVELRELVALSESESKALLTQLHDAVSPDALLITTCNRTELYVRPNDESITTDILIDFLLRAKQLPPGKEQELRQSLMRLTHCDAITHLFEVISGIDSQIIGDQQIFAQVKDAFRQSEEAGTNGGFMLKLAHAAFRVAKRVRSETELGIGAATVSYAAVEFTRKVYDDLRDRTALIIGAGETAELAAKHLVERHIGSLIIANRTVDKGREMLQNVRDGQPNAKDDAVSLDELAAALRRSDIVISSTAAPGYVLTPELVKSGLHKRKSYGPMILLDIAVPRDIDPKIGELDNIFLKDIDDLRAIVDQNLERRKEELPKVHSIIKEELEGFLSLQSKLEAGPTIKRLREKFEAVRREELERNLAKLTPEQQSLVDEMTRRMMNRLLHTPTVMLKEPRNSMDDLLARIELINALFALDEVSDENKPTSDH